MSNLNSSRRNNVLDESKVSNYSIYTDVTKTGRKKLNIKSNIRSIHAYKQHIHRNVTPEKENKEEEKKPLNLLVNKEEQMSNLLNNPENFLLSHEPEVTKNPVVVMHERQQNPEIEIRPLKEDKSLKNRDISNPRKIKKRRRRSKRRKKRLSNIDVSTNSNSMCSLAGI